MTAVQLRRVPGPRLAIQHWPKEVQALHDRVRLPRAAALLSWRREELGFDKVMPPSVLGRHKPKDLLKKIPTFIKEYEVPRCGVGALHIPLQALSLSQLESRFLDIVSCIPGFGRRTFSVKLVSTLAAQCIC